MASKTLESSNRSLYLSIIERYIDFLESSTHDGDEYNHNGGNSKIIMFDPFTHGIVVHKIDTINDFVRESKTIIDDIGQVPVRSFDWNHDNLSIRSSK